MKKYIGIIVAEVEEINAIKYLMKTIDELNLYNLNIFKGTINDKDCLLIRCGVGKVNAARTVQLLLDKFNIEYIINLGSAGALIETLNIGDIVVGKQLVQHDFDVTAFGREKGYIPEAGKFFECNNKLFQACENIKIYNQKIEFGTIASGDIFCTDIIMKEKIKENFNAVCVEMEGAAIAQVCYLSNIPFIVIRSISDSPNGNNQIDFNEYLKIASKNCAEFIKCLLALLA